MSELDEKLARLHEAQRDLYGYLGVTRREAHDVSNFHRASFYAHSEGLSDITVPYPEVLDYRHSSWRIVDSHTGKGQEVIQILPTDETDWEAEQVVRFHLYSIKDGDEGLVYVIGSHLPKPHELEYEFPDDVAKVEAGGLVFGNRCFLLLDPANGYSEVEEYREYFN